MEVEKESTIHRKEHSMKNNEFVTNWVLETVKRETTKTIIASWLLREARQEEIEILWRYMLMRKKKR